MVWGYFFWGLWTLLLYVDEGLWLELDGLLGNWWFYDVGDYGMERDVRSKNEDEGSLVI